MFGFGMCALYAHGKRWSLVSPTTMSGTRGWLKVQRPINKHVESEIECQWMDPTYRRRESEKMPHVVLSEYVDPCQLDGVSVLLVT